MTLDLLTPGQAPKVREQGVRGLSSYLHPLSTLHGRNAILSLLILAESDFSHGGRGIHIKSD